MKKYDPPLEIRKFSTTSYCNTKEKSIKTQTDEKKKKKKETPKTKHKCKQ